MPTLLRRIAENSYSVDLVSRARAKGYPDVEIARAVHKKFIANFRELLDINSNQDYLRQLPKILGDYVKFTRGTRLPFQLSPKWGIEMFYWDLKNSGMPHRIVYEEP